MTFTLTSPAFQQSRAIPTAHTCDGKDVSPPLHWEGAPEGAASFALIVDDPDAPRGAFVHWVLYDVPGHATELPENVGPSPELENLGETRQGKNGFGYDPIFFYPPLGKTFGELDRKAKDAVSHRGKALQKLREAWPSLFPSKVHSHS